MHGKAFSRWLGVQMKAHGWSLSEVSDRLGVTRSAVQKWVMARGMPDPKYVPKLARILGVPPIEVWRFYGDDDEIVTDVLDWYSIRIADWVTLPQQASRDDIEQFLWHLRIAGQEMIRANAVYKRQATRRVDLSAIEAAEPPQSPGALRQVSATSDVLLFAPDDEEDGPAPHNGTTPQS